jgi:hypothetical protein
MCEKDDKKWPLEDLHEANSKKKPDADQWPLEDLEKGVKKDKKNSK